MLINLKPHGIFRSSFAYLLFIHFNIVQTLGMHIGDDTLSSIILAGRGILVKMLITLKGMLYMYFDKKNHTYP